MARAITLTLVLLLLAARSAAPATTDALSAALAGVPFSDGLVGRSNNSDAYGTLDLACYYLEVENVTCTSCSWGGKCQVLTMRNSSAPPAPKCLSRSSAPAATFDACSDRCCADSNCQAWVFVTTLQAPGSEDQCVHGGSCCWLKNGVPAESPDNYPGGIWSGTTTQPAPGPVVVPPTGIRNAVPLGGLGAGTMELRGDGTLHEITIHSASPGGAAKYATQPDAMLSLLINGGQARSVRTAPPAYSVPGLAQIAYSGTYPVSRLSLYDPSSLGAAGLTATIYAYHHFRPNDAPTSAAPAVTFTLSVTNGGAGVANVSLMFQLPFAAMQSCERVDFTSSTSSVVASYAACLHTCANSSGCAAWNFASASGNCSLLPAAGRMVFMAGSFCGVAGAGWDSSDATSLSLSMHPGDARSEAGPAVGDVALRPISSGAGSVISFGVADDPAALFVAFASSGGAGFAAGTSNGVTGGSFSGLAAAHGAVSVTSPPIQPGETASVSVTWAWFFPHRDYYGRTVGQFYQTLFGSAKDVAGLYTNEHLAVVAADAAAHTSVFAGPAAASLPQWLTDHLVNQFSHVRNFIFARDGTMREHEANDCPDLDRCDLRSNRTAPPDSHTYSLSLLSTSAQCPQRRASTPLIPLAAAQGAGLSLPAPERPTRWTAGSPPPPSPSPPPPSPLTTPH